MGSVATPTAGTVRLHLAKSLASGTGTPGATVVYNLSVVNSGTQDSGPVTLVETVPANTSWAGGGGASRSRRAGGAWSPTRPPSPPPAADLHRQQIPFGLLKAALLLGSLAAWQAYRRPSHRSARSTTFCRSSRSFSGRLPSMTATSPTSKIGYSGKRRLRGHSDALFHRRRQPGYGKLRATTRPPPRTFPPTRWKSLATDKAVERLQQALQADGFLPVRDLTKAQES